MRALRFGIDRLPVPRLRGRIHQVSIAPVLAAGVALTLLARDVRGSVALAVFTFSIVAMLTASTVYHCHTSSTEAKHLARRIDHGTIFVAIAGTQTAFWLLSAPASVAAPIVTVVWLITILGFRHKLRNLSELDSAGSWLYGALGWSGVLLIPFLLGGGLIVLALVLLGGAAYSVGGVLLHHKAGNLWPGVFGYHETWHTLVMIGVVLHGAGLVALAGVSI
jgi:hemolysin III